jgi:signal transduction histidine kinase
MTRLTGEIVVVGGLITIALLFIGMFTFFTKRRYFLYYALLLLMIAGRVLLTGDKPVMEFLPTLDWYLSIRAEYLNVILIFVFALIYFYTLYYKLIGKPVLVTALSLATLYGGFVVFAGPMFFGAINLYFYALCGAVGLYILIRLALGLRKGGIERALVFIGLLLFLLAAINDQIQYSFHIFMWLYDAISVWMLAFVYMNMIALFIGFSKTEAALYESDRKAEMLAAKTALYTQINHDIRTPLTVISNYAQMVMEQLAEGGADEQTVADLHTIRNEAGRLAEMASNALRSSESGNRPGPLDIAVIVRQIKEIFAGQMKFSGRGLTAELPEKLPPVWGGADDITRLLWNLMDNAVKHNEQGGIALRAASDGEIVTVTVADEGEGIAPELLPKLFTRGVSGTGGTGLGLSICREIARKYHGDVTVRCESGKGTAAALTLPVYHTEEKTDG